MTQYGFYFDATRCTGCKTCEAACRDYHDLPLELTYRHVYELEGGSWSQASDGTWTTDSYTYYTSFSCSHCANPACMHVCPTGAITIYNQIGKAWRAIHDPKVRTVVQIAPAVRVAVGEAFGLPAGQNVLDQLVTALKFMGVDEVYDTTFGADFTTIEESQEFLARLEKGGPFPMFTSCCPGWVRFLKGQFPDYTDNLSTAKSPQQMFGAVAKTWYAEKMGIDPKDLVVVSIMPCTAKKFETGRDNESAAGVPDVDIALTTRELARMIQRAGLDFANLPDEDFDAPLGITTGAGAIFGATGGVMEAALRSAYFLHNGRNPKPEDFRAVRGDATGASGWTEAEFDLGGEAVVRTAVVSGLANTGRLLAELQAGESITTLWKSWPARAAARAAADSPSTPTTWSGRPSAARCCTTSTASRRCGSAMKTRRSTPCTGRNWASRAAKRPKPCCTPTTTPGRCPPRADA